MSVVVPLVVSAVAFVFWVATLSGSTENAFEGILLSFALACVSAGLWIAWLIA